MSEFKQIALSAYRLFIAVHGNVSLFLQRYKEAATKHLNLAADADTSFVRIRVFGVLTWGKGRDMQPPNSDYWGRAEALVKQLEAWGLGIDLDLEDGNSLDQPRQIDDHWFITKVIGDNPRYKELREKFRHGPGLTDAERAEFIKIAQGFYDMNNWTDALKEERKVYMKKWLDLLERHKIDYRICIINEPPWTLNTFGSFYNWHHYYLTWIFGCNVPTERIIATTHLDYLQKGRSAPCGILAPHDIWQPAQTRISFPVSITKYFKILYSQDGNWSKGRSPFMTYAELAAFGKAIHDSVGIGAEIKCNDEVGAGDYMECGKMDFGVVEAFAQAVNPAPEPPPPTPPEPTPPEPEPEPPEPQPSLWQRILEFLAKILKAIAGK